MNWEHFNGKQQQQQFKTVNSNFAGDEGIDWRLRNTGVEREGFDEYHHSF